MRRRTVNKDLYCYLFIFLKQSQGTYLNSELVKNSIMHLLSLLLGTFCLQAAVVKSQGN